MYRAHRAADGTVSTVRVAGTGAASGLSDPPFPAVDREVQLIGHSLSEHWAFGGSDEGDREGLVVMPRAGIADGPWAFRVSILQHADEADSAIIVVRRENVTSQLDAAPRPGPVAPMWDVLEATKGLWPLAGCCRYVYEIDARDEMRIHSIEGPFPLIYGVDPEEMREPTFALFLRNVFPEDRPFPEAVRKILEETGSWTGAYRVRGSDGRVRHVRHFAVRCEREGNAFVSGLILDESAAVASSEESSVFRLAIENSHEGFAITDSKGRYLYLNQEHGRLFGYQNPGELLGKEWRVLYRPEEVELIQQRISHDVDMAGFWRGHVLAVRKDGSRFQQDLTLSRLANGGILCICRDRSEELELNARLEESETMLRTLFGALPMRIVIRDEHGVLQFTNGFTARKESPGAADTGRAGWAEGDEEWERRQLDADRRVLATGKSFEYVIDSGDARQRRWFHCIVFLVQAPPGVSRRIGTLIMDITRQKELEQEANSVSERRRELLETQREFISMVSHEFRSPLTAIEGAQFLLEKLLHETAGLKASVAGSANKWLGLQASALATLRKLVDQVLMLIRIEHMTGEVSLELTSPAEILKETVTRFNDSIDSPRVILRNDLPPGYVASVDSGLIKAAAENLISNGLKYSGLGKSVNVHVYTERDGWAVEVADQGRGIPREDQAKLFQPFFRAGNVDTVPGTGLGLAIVQRAVDFHSGKIEFESRENEGTRFRLHFPGIAHPPQKNAVPGPVPVAGS